MSPKNKTIITLGIFLLLLILLVVFVVFPLFKSITKNASSFLSAKAEIASIDAEMDNLDSLKNQYQEYKPNLDRINQFFINAEVPIGFIRFLENLATTSQILARVSPGSAMAKNDSPWIPLYFQISARGSFVHFSRFLEKLENAPYLIEVQDLSMSSLESETDESPGINADFSIKVYAQ